MSTPTVQSELCRTCGADIREGSAFCYYCGKELFPDRLVNGASGSDAIHLSDLPEIPAPSEPLADAANGKPANRNRPRRARRPEIKIVEVAWVPADGSPTLFYVVSTVLAGIAILLIALALYLR